MSINNEPQARNNGRQTAAVKGRSRGWIWFFAILVVLTVAATAFLWIYNVRQQLTPEELAAAHKLWKQKRPSDYVLTYTKEGSASGTFVVTVRKGEVKSVVMKQDVTENGRVKTVSTALPKRLYQSSDMDGLFRDLERFLEMNKDPAQGRAYLTANFDPDDGHINGFIYSNSRTGQRVKVLVELEQPGDKKSSR
jgi:hypothetical protein